MDIIAEVRRRHFVSKESISSIALRRVFQIDGRLRISGFIHNNKAAFRYIVELLKVIVRVISAKKLLKNTLIFT